jgi:hypothetical protein
MLRAEDKKLGIGLRIFKKLRVSRQLRRPTRRSLWPVAMIADGEQKPLLRAGRAFLVDLPSERLLFHTNHDHGVELQPLGFVDRDDPEARSAEKAVSAADNPVPSSSRSAGLLSKTGLGDCRLDRMRAARPYTVLYDQEAVLIPAADGRHRSQYVVSRQPQRCRLGTL